MPTNTTFAGAKVDYEAAIAATFEPDSPEANKYRLRGNQGGGFKNIKIIFN